MRHTPESCGCDCAHCPFAREGKPVSPVLADGPSVPKAIVIAESPGPEEIEQGRPLVGMTGRRFEESLASVGLDRDDLLLLNAMACRPKDGKTEGDMKAAVNACRPYVATVLAERSEETPMFIAGKWAWFSITGRDEGYGNERGFLQYDINTKTCEGIHKAVLAAEEAERLRVEGIRQRKAHALLKRIIKAIKKEIRAKK